MASRYKPVLLEFNTATDGLVAAGIPAGVGFGRSTTRPPFPLPPTDVEVETGAVVAARAISLELLRTPMISLYVVIACATTWSML